MLDIINEYVKQEISNVSLLFNFFDDKGMYMAMAMVELLVRIS
jgi:hypothetical protein